MKPPFVAARLREILDHESPSLGRRAPDHTVPIATLPAVPVPTAGSQPTSMLSGRDCVKEDANVWVLVPVHFVGVIGNM